MTKTLLTVGIVGLVALAPYGVKTISDKVIEKRIDELKTNGIKLEILNSQGYLQSKRDFVLTIENENKFKELLKQGLVSKYPVYENIIEELFKKDSREFDEFLRGIVFKGNILNSNVDLNSDIKVTTSLDKFSNKIMNEIKKDEESKKIVLPFIEKGGLTAFMTYSSEGILKDFRLKDINEEIETKDSLGREVSSNIKLLGSNVVNKSTKDRIIADMNLDDLILEVNAKDNTKISLSNLDYSINYKNELENTGVLSFEKFNFINNEDGIKLGKTILEAKGEVYTNNYSTTGIIKTNSFHANTPKGDVDIDSLALNINVDNIDYSSLKKVNESYIKLQSLTIEPNMTKNERKVALENVVQPMLESLNSLINKGFLVDLKISLKDFKNENLELDSINVVMNGTLNKNSVNLKYLNNQSILKEIEAVIDISMLKTDMENIFKIINPQMAMMLSMYAKEENNKVIYSIELNRGQIAVNGKNLN